MSFLEVHLFLLSVFKGTKPPDVLPLELLLIISSCYFNHSVFYAISLLCSRKWKIVTRNKLPSTVSLFKHHRNSMMRQTHHWASLNASEEILYGHLMGIICFLLVFSSYLWCGKLITELVKRFGRNTLWAFNGHNLFSTCLQFLFRHNSLINTTKSLSSFIKHRRKLGTLQTLFKTVFFSGVID